MSSILPRSPPGRLGCGFEGPVFLRTSTSTVPTVAGTFRFERLVGEQVSVYAFRDGHGLAVETVATDQEGVELRLPAGLTLSGVLLDAERRPLAGHQVIVAGADRMVRHTTTDAQGAFALRGLPEGACAVTVTDKGGSLVLETNLPGATEGTELRLPAK